MKKIFIPLLLLIVLNEASFAQFNKSGRTTFQFLKIGVGARQTGMGEAAIANTYDVNSVFWNPAALTQIQNLEASFSYTSWIGDLNLMSGVIGFRWEGVGQIAVHYNTLDYGSLQEALTTSTSGNIDTRTGQSFSGSDLAIGVAIARKFTDKLSIGVNVNYLRENLFTYSTSLISFDVGSYYETGWKGVRLAMSAQNFSSQARWLHTKEESQQSYELPIVYRIGWSIDFLGGEDLFFGGNPEQHKVSFNMDATHTNDYGERVNLGMEYNIFNLISLRGGYRFNYDEGNLSFGIGLNYQAGPIKLLIDYSYVKYDFLESPNRFTVNMAF